MFVLIASICYYTGTTLTLDPAHMRVVLDPVDAKMRVTMALLNLWFIKVFGALCSATLNEKSFVSNRPIEHA